MPKYLSKSRFKVAYECPAKLYYNEQPKVYGNTKSDNEFLKALAKGGFQVGALAKIYYSGDPGATDLEGLATQDAIAKTNQLLTQDNVTIFEAAIQTGPFLVRVDILQKQGNQISLIEVKSKTFDASSHKDFFVANGKGILAKWEEYLVDVAYQTWVTKQAHPKWKITPYLMLADKSAQATVNGLHQFFRLESANQRTAQVRVKPGLALKDVGDPILKTVNVSREVDFLVHEELFPTQEKLPEYAHYLAGLYQSQTKGLARISSLCKNCEFRVGKDVVAAGLKSGFDECWHEADKIKPTDKNRALIFDIWNCRKTPELLAADKLFFDQLTEEDLKPKSKPNPDRALQPYQRQWIQIEKQLDGDPSPYIDHAGLKTLFEEVTYPLHCIDFETATVAIPFHKGRRPYEQIAFQFSHHILHKDGPVEHADQYLSVAEGEFPNFDFLRKLRASLAKDDGTIFRYAAHENTVLRQIRDQLIRTPQPDQSELLAFIDLITQPRKEEKGTPGSRNMVDLLQVVLEHYYHPRMGGSNSIKKVIPAVLAESKFLQKKYSAPTSSLNEPRVWVQFNPDGSLKDPYTLLPPVFTDLSQTLFNDDAPLFEDDSIDDGGAALTAWSRMQFTEMSAAERGAVSSALLRYCELDTLSMVWLLEYWGGV